MRTHGVYFPDGSKPRAVSSTNELGQSAGAGARAGAGASMARAVGQQPILTGDNAASTHFNHNDNSTEAHRFYINPKDIESGKFSLNVHNLETLEPSEEKQFRDTHAGRYNTGGGASNSIPDTTPTQYIPAYPSPLRDISRIELPRVETMTNHSNLPEVVAHYKGSGVIVENPIDEVLNSVRHTLSSVSFDLPLEDPEPGTEEYTLLENKRSSQTASFQMSKDCMTMVETNNFAKYEEFTTKCNKLNEHVNSGRIDPQDLANMLCITHQNIRALSYFDISDEMQGVATQTSILASKTVLFTLLHAMNTHKADIADNELQWSSDMIQIIQTLSMADSKISSITQSIFTPDEHQKLQQLRRGIHE